MKYQRYGVSQDEINIVIGHTDSKLKVREGVPDDDVSAQVQPYMQFIYAHHFVQVWLDCTLKPTESHVANRTILSYVRNR